MKMIVIGATGTIGNEVVGLARSLGWQVTEVSYSGHDGWVSFQNEGWTAKIQDSGPFDSVVWAQGANSSMSIDEVTEGELKKVFDANITSVVKTYQDLLSGKLLASPARGVIVSSIWQEAGRAGKTAYLISKSAVSGLVRSFAADCSINGFFVNAVLPGPIDSKMTRENLDLNQIERILSVTPNRKLPTAREVAEAVVWLSSPSASGVVGASLPVDNGWLANRHV